MFDLVPFKRRSRNELTRSDDLFESLFNNVFDMMDVRNMAFRTDVKETENEYILEAELPGMSKEDINIELDDNYLQIFARKDEVKEEQNGNYIRRERRAGEYNRSFYIENVDENKISARYDNGILNVVLPKKEPTTVNKRTIDIE